MGGETFDNTTTLSLEEYNSVMNKLEPNIKAKYFLPFRLKNKTSFSDLDFIVYEENQLIEQIQLKNNNVIITDTKIIPLFGNTFNNLYSKHLLVSVGNLKNIQVDLLRPWCEDSLEFTRAYFSYSCANIFFSKIIDILDRNLTLSYLGVICSSNKINIPNDVKHVRIVDTNNNNSTTRIIFDTKYIFKLMDLDYDIFVNGFDDEFMLLEYLKTSKYYEQIQFSNNSKFRHNIKRLETFKNLVDNNLLNLK